jgi:hypothetical protein
MMVKRENFFTAPAKKSNFSCLAHSLVTTWTELPTVTILFHLFINNADPLFSLQMGGMECVITGLMDEFHSFFHGRRFAREIFTLGAATVSFSIALINVTPVGAPVS